MDLFTERADELAETMTAAGWTVEHRYDDPDSPWAGGVQASKRGTTVSIVADPQHGGYIAAVSDYNDYSGADPVRLAESLHGTRY